MRKRVFEIIEVAKESDVASKIYDFVMMVTIIVSILPLVVKNEITFFTILDKVTVLIFIIDYFLRWATADYKLKRKGWSFFLYPFTPMAIFDVLSILPSVIIISNAFRLLKILRLLRTLRVLRIFKVVRYSKNIMMLKNVIVRSKNSLCMVCLLAVGYIVVSALVIFNVEPETFNNIIIVILMIFFLFSFLNFLHISCSYDTCRQCNNCNTK